MASRRKKSAHGEARRRLAPLPFPVTEYEEQAARTVRSGEYGSVGKALYAYSLHPLRIDHCGHVRLRWPREQANLLDITVKEYLNAVAVLMDIGAYLYREGTYYHLIPDDVLPQVSGPGLHAGAEGET